MGISLLPLEEISDHAEDWRKDIQRARDDLAFWWIQDEFERMEGEKLEGLPHDDRMRWRSDGTAVHEQDLSRLLDNVIDSWV